VLEQRKESYRRRQPGNRQPDLGLRDGTVSMRNGFGRPPSICPREGGWPSGDNSRAPESRALRCPDGRRADPACRSGSCPTPCRTRVSKIFPPARPPACSRCPRFRLGEQPNIRVRRWRLITSSAGGARRLHDKDGQGPVAALRSRGAGPPCGLMARAGREAAAMDPQGPGWDNNMHASGLSMTIALGDAGAYDVRARAGELPA